VRSPFFFKKIDKMDQNAHPGQIVYSIKNSVAPAGVCNSSSVLHCGTLTYYGACSKSIDGFGLAHYKCDSCQAIVHYFLPLFAPMRSIHFNSNQGLSDIEVLGCQNIGDKNLDNLESLTTPFIGPLPTTTFISVLQPADNALPSLPPFFPKNEQNRFVLMGNLPHKTT